MPTREPRTPGARVRAHPWLTGVVATLAVVLPLITVLGGWARSSPDGAARVQVGTWVDATPFQVRLEEASARFRVNGTDAEPGLAFVVLEGQIRSSVPTSVSSTTLTRAFAADLEDTYSVFGSPSETAEASVRVSSDGSSLLGIGPGLRYDVQIIFVVAEASVPERLGVTLLAHLQRASELDGRLGWFSPTPVAEATLAVAPLPPVRPEPEGF